MKIMKTCLTAIISSLMIFSPMAYADKWSDQFPHIKATEIFLVTVLMRRCLRKITKEKLLK